MDLSDAELAKRIRGHSKVTVDFAHVDISVVELHRYMAEWTARRAAELVLEGLSTQGEET